MQWLLQHERVHPIRIVARDGFRHAVAVTFVKGKRGRVIHCGFQYDAVAAYGAQTIFRRSQQSRTNSKATACRGHVNCENVPDPSTPGLRNDEPKNGGVRFIGLTSFAQCLRDHRKSPTQTDVSRKLQSGICNSWGKTFLINPPQAVEILSSKLSQGKIHQLIVAAELHIFRAS